MPAPTDRGEPAAIAPAAVDLAAEQLLGAIDGACDPTVGFPAQLDAALSAGLALFANDPELIRALCIQPLSEPSRAAQQRCSAGCVARLRAAGGSGPARSTFPAITERFLIAAVAFEASRALHEEKASLLPERVALLRDFILLYYPEASTS